MDWVTLLFIATYACLLGTLGAYVAFHLAISRAISPEKAEELTDTVLDYLVKTSEGQERLYMLGGLVASGFGQGVGVKKGSGKFSMNDVISQLIGGFLQKKIPGVAPSQQNETIRPERTM